MRGGLRETSATEAKTSEQHQKNTRQMPDQSDPRERNVRGSHDAGDGLMKESDANVEQEKIGVEGIKLRMN